MGWFWLFLAILLEVGGTTCMKLSQGFTTIIPSVLMFVFYILSFSAMTLSLKSVDVSVGYAVWAGIGTVLITLIGVVWFGESLGFFKIVSIILIIVGVVGLRLSV